MADQPVSSLTAVASGDIEQLSSLFLYGLDNGDDRKIPGDIVQTMFGTNPGVIAVRSSNLSFPNDVATAVLWQATVYDFGGWFDANSGTRLTVPNDRISYIQIAAALEWAISGTGRRRLLPQINGAGFRGMSISEISSYTIADFRQHIVTAPIPVNSGDFIETLGHQVSGGALNLNVDDATYCAVWPIAFR